MTPACSILLGNYQGSPVHSLNGLNLDCPPKARMLKVWSPCSNDQGRGFGESLDHQGSDLMCGLIL